MPGTPGLHAGDVVSVVNGDSRTVTTLHVADLRVDITGSGSTVASGHCQPDPYYGAFEYSKASKANGTVRVKLSRGGRIAALGQARLRHGRATVTLRARGPLKRGRITITLVAPGLGTTSKNVTVR